MLKQSLVCVSVLALFVLAGCGSQKGETVMTMGKGDAMPPMKTVTEAGNYAVYGSTSYNPIDRSRLEVGDQYGFRMTQTDKEKKYFAVVKTKSGEREIPLQMSMTTGYLWKMEK